MQALEGKLFQAEGIFSKHSVLTVLMTFKWLVPWFAGAYCERENWEWWMKWYSELYSVSKGKSLTQKNTSTLMFIAAYLQLPSYGSSPSVHRWVDKTAMGHLPNGILLSCKKENFTLCNSMDRPEEHYAMWNRPVREKQIPYDFTYMWNWMNKLNKQRRDRLVESRLTALGVGGRLWGGGTKQKGKRTHGQVWWLQGGGVYKGVQW